ncbi:MAG: hypothetical protein EBX49_01015 [Synechococcaceae bacterium WB8_1B_136]|nr:hypothetical protein [Synechococcaceae bacterium WB8_1B_136]
MDFLCERQAEYISGGHRPSMGHGRAPIASLLRGLLGRQVGSPMGPAGSITTNVNQINLAFNIVMNGGSIVNNQLNGLDLSVVG